MLAGRIVYEELPDLDALEIGSERDPLWIRSGFLGAFTAWSDAASPRWRLNFNRTYLEARHPAVRGAGSGRDPAALLDHAGPPAGGLLDTLGSLPAVSAFQRPR
ncbi:MAG: hypothetical protein F4X40_03120 [Chloroflexi bacterium]|nr:hypothetical protein [Chloroflexota bacterium]